MTDSNGQTPIPVPFHDSTLFIVEYNNEPYTPMKPIVEGMGLGWGSQRQKLFSNEKRWGVTMIVTPSKGGEQQTVCMPVRKLPGYLSSIHPSKVKPEIADRVVAFQNECDDVLWQYWSEGRSVPVRAHGRRQPQPAKQATKSLEDKVLEREQTRLKAKVGGCRMCAAVKPMLGDNLCLICYRQLNPYHAPQPIGIIINHDLDTETMTALQKSAVENIRPLDHQALYLLKGALRERGYMAEVVAQ